MNKLIVFVFLIFFTHFSFAYLGPGAGGGILITALGIVLAILLIIISLLIKPFRKIYQKLRKKSK